MLSLPLRIAATLLLLCVDSVSSGLFDIDFKEVIPAATVRVRRRSPSPLPSQHLQDSSPGAALSRPGWDVIVVAGQSNSIGRSGRFYVGTEAQPPATIDGLPLTLLMPCNTSTLPCSAGRGPYIAERMTSPAFFEWQTAGLSSGLRRELGSVGPAWEFVQRYVSAELQRGRSVLVVPASIGGTPMICWEAPADGRQGGDLFQRMASMISSALAVSTPPAAMSSSEASTNGSGSENKVVAVLWCQGEADRSVHPGETVASSSLRYQARLWGMIAGIRGLPGVGLTVPFVSADPVRNPGSWQLPHRAFAYAYLPNAGWPQLAAHASSEGLRTLCHLERASSYRTLHCDHLDEASLREMGRRWWRAWRAVARSHPATPTPPRAVTLARWRRSADALILDLPHVAGPLSPAYWDGPRIPALVRVQLIWSLAAAASPPPPLMMWTNTTRAKDVFPDWLPGGGCSSCSSMPLSPVLTFTPYRQRVNSSTNGSVLLVPGQYAADLSISLPAREVSTTGAAQGAFFGNMSDEGDRTLVAMDGAPRCGGAAGARAPLVLSSISSDLTTLSLPLFALCMPPLFGGDAPAWCTDAGWVAVITPVFAQPRLVAAPQRDEDDDLSEDGSRRAAPGTPPGELGLAMELVLGDASLLRLPGGIRAPMPSMYPTRSTPLEQSQASGEDSPSLADTDVWWVQPQSCIIRTSVSATNESTPYGVLSANSLQIIMDTKGRLGNQLFEAAFAYALAENISSIGRKTCLYLTSRWNNVGGGFAAVPLFTDENTPFVPTANLSDRTRTRKFGEGVEISVVARSIAHLLAANLSSVTTLKLDGFFQYPEFFDIYKERLRQLFRPSKAVATDLRVANPGITHAVCYHVRGGDKLWSSLAGRYFMPDSAYYANAFRIIEEANAGTAQSAPPYHHFWPPTLLLTP